MRVRDIIHRDGRRLRIGFSSGLGGDGPVIRLGDPGRNGAGTIMLDLYGGELLAAFLMGARLSRLGELADERCNGDFPLHLRLSARGGEMRVEIDQLGHRLDLAQPLWDRLYAELQLVLAHGRQLGRMTATGTLLAGEGRRLLH